MTEKSRGAFKPMSVSYGPTPSVVDIAAGVLIEQGRSLGRVEALKALQAQVTATIKREQETLDGLNTLAAEHRIKLDELASPGGRAAHRLLAVARAVRTAWSGS